jgi:uncharacterized protein YacL
MGVKIEKLEVFLIFSSLILIGIVLLSPPVKSTNYVAEAVRGFTTLGGILVAFIGFSLNHSYVDFKVKQTKDWIKLRIQIISILIMVSLFGLLISYTVMVVNNDLQFAFKSSLFGVILIICLFFECISILLTEKVELTKKLTP